MVDSPLDNIDRGILHLLQENARNNSATYIGEQVGVTSTTVGNRIQDLESEGIIRGYYPDIDYQQAGMALRMLFVCTADPHKREELAEQALNVRGVITVRQLLAGRRNVHIDVVANTTEDLERLTNTFHEIGLEIVSSELTKEMTIQPWNHFYVSDDSVIAGTEEAGEE